MSSSSAFFGILTITIISILLNSDGWFGAVAVDAKPLCSGKEVSHPYDSDVGKLVFQLQQLAPRNSATWAATLTVGHVTGAASCDWDITYNDCLTCLGWAATDLSVDCKGRESGSSKGLGGCDMSFKPAY
ncbi:hypothetical protein LINPERPRIM_LOCUS35857 [Linum perenne]